MATLINTIPVINRQCRYLIPIGKRVKIDRDNAKEVFTNAGQLISTTYLPTTSLKSYREWLIFDAPIPELYLKTLYTASFNAGGALNHDTTMRVTVYYKQVTDDILNWSLEHPTGFIADQDYKDYDILLTEKLNTFYFDAYRRVEGQIFALGVWTDTRLDLEDNQPYTASVTVSPIVITTEPPSLMIPVLTKRASGNRRYVTFSEKPVFPDGRQVAVTGLGEGYDVQAVYLVKDTDTEWRYDVGSTLEETSSSVVGGFVTLY